MLFLLQYSCCLRLHMRPLQMETQGHLHFVSGLWLSESFYGSIFRCLASRTSVITSYQFVQVSGSQQEAILPTHPPNSWQCWWYLVGRGQGCYKKFVFVFLSFAYHLLKASLQLASTCILFYMITVFKEKNKRIL